MPRQMGARSQLLVKKESSYGVAPSGNWQKMPVRSYDVVIANDIVPDPAIGFGHRESIDPSQGPVDLKGPLVVPVDVRNIGFWLSMLLGTESVSGTGPYVHVFKPEETTNLNSFSAELGHVDTGKYFVHSGLMINKGTFNFAGSGLASLSMDAIGQSQTKATSSGGGTPTAPVYTPFSQLQGAIFEDSAGSTNPANAIANITAATLAIDNQMNAEIGVGSAGKILGGDAGQLVINGEFTLRFADTTMYDLAVAKTFISASWGWTIDSNNSLLIACPRLVLGNFTPPLSGPGGVMAKVPFHVSRDSGAATSLIATLTNDVTSY
ncbi:MAG: hypothetical protein ISS15_05350 [Alphaproteobacteria bacterium]|nr:hypothetical protein [Alphaproteobacteria bacterium]MBL6939454.1 hypothetical protein [Alphaproteobacteria bacterium]MBL7097065.1 hypothetical protein [Alphaproteobacteria bacterium]